MAEKKSKIISWLAVLQGFSMLLVVLGHVTLTDQFKDPSVPAQAKLESVIYGFHMPLFMFVSGWLFYHTCIGRGASFQDVVKRKFKRIGVPFLFFTVVTLFLKLAVSGYVKRPVDITEVVNTFLLFSSNPLGEMWFLTVLMELMLLYPLYAKCNNSVRLALLLCLSVVLSLVVPRGIAVYRISLFCEMVPFFVAGIMASRYGFVERYSLNKYFLCAFSVAFIGMNLCDSMEYVELPARVKALIEAFSGVGFSVCLCVAVSRYLPTLFSSFRTYTFQIFLLGIFFQIMCRHLYAVLPEWTYCPLFALSVVGAIYLPVVFSEIIGRRLPKFKILFGL